MSMIERVLYWIAIVIIVIALIGTKSHLSNLEAKLNQTQSSQTEGGQK